MCGLEGGGMEEENCDLCDIDQTFNPYTKKDLMQLFKRYSPDTSSLESGIVPEKVVEKGL